MMQGNADYSPITIQPETPAYCTVFGLLALAFGLFFSGLANATVDGKRVALVIGNSTYAHTTPLKNPKNDAKDVAAALRRLGFDVIEGTDLAQQQMREKVRTFASKIEGANVALFYYAGHGVQVDGNNYLAPVGARLRTESDLDFETVGLNFILRQMEREKRTNLVFLDACRDNPLSHKLARSMKTRSTAVGRGLARVESGVGMLIGYATSPGNVALDGKGRNSPYTTALLKHIEEPGVGINDMMIQVRNAVVLASNGKQVPWEHSSLTGQFYFKPKLKKVAAVETSPPKKPERRISNDLTNRSLISTAYQATVAVGTCGAHRVFEEQHRGSFYGRLAEEWLKSNCAEKQRKVQVEAKPEPVETVEAKADQDETKQIKPEPENTVQDKTGEAKPEPVETVKAKADQDEKKQFKPEPEKTVQDKTGEAKPVVVAAVKPADTTETKPVAVKLTGPALVLAVQKELDRLGCAPGRPDGKWGRRSQHALRTFDAYAKLSLSTTGVTADTLATLKSRTAPICPLQCRAGKILKNGRCVARVVPQQQPVERISPKKRTPPVVKKAAKPRPKRRPPPRRKAPKQDRFWGGEDTASECRRGLWTGDCFPQR